MSEKNKLIGHNNPPKDRKVNWKSISLNEYVYKDLKQCADYYRQLRNCFGLLNGGPPQENPSMPWVIEMLVQEKLCMINRIDRQDVRDRDWETIS